MNMANFVESIVLILVGLLLFIYTIISYKRKSVVVTRRTFDISKWITKIGYAKQPVLFSAVIVGYFLIALVLIIVGICVLLQ